MDTSTPRLKKKKNPPSANSGSKFSRTSSPPSTSMMIEPLETYISGSDVKIQSSAINRRICKNLVLFIRSHLCEFLYFFFFPGWDNFPAISRRQKSIPNSSVELSTVSDGIPPCVFVSSHRMWSLYTPAAHEASEERTHARIQRVCAVGAPTCVTSMYSTQRAPLDNICADCNTYGIT